MERELIESMTEEERAAVMTLHGEMNALIETMVDSFGFEEKEDTDYKSDIMRVAESMINTANFLRPELLSDFDDVFNKITMVYFEPDRFFEFTAEYRDAQGVIQLDEKTLSEFYGRTMAKLVVLKTEFEEKFALLA